MTEPMSVLPQPSTPNRVESPSTPALLTEREVSLSELLLLPHRYPRLFLALFLLTAIPGILFLIFAPRRYETEAILKIGRVPSEPFNPASLSHLSDPGLLLSRLKNAIQDSEKSKVWLIAARKLSKADVGQQSTEGLILLRARGPDPLTVYQYLQTIIYRNILASEEARFYEYRDTLFKYQATLNQKLEALLRLRDHYERLLQKHSSSPVHYLRLSQIEEEITSLESQRVRLELTLKNPEFSPSTLVSLIPFPLQPSFPPVRTVLLITLFLATVIAYIGCYFRFLQKSPRA